MILAFRLLSTVVGSKTLRIKTRPCEHLSMLIAVGMSGNNSKGPPKMGMDPIGPNLFFPSDSTFREWTTGSYPLVFRLFTGCL